MYLSDDFGAFENRFIAWEESLSPDKYSQFSCSISQGYQRDSLYVVVGLDDPNGLDIKDVLEEYHGTDINHGRLYPNLNILVEMGLLEKREKNKRTNAYSLTARGRREIESRRGWENQYV